MIPWLKPHTNGSLLDLYIQPGASKSELVGEFNGRLKIRIKGAAREGEANKDLMEFLSKVLKISKKQIFLIHGESSRQKQVLVELSPEKVLSLLSDSGLDQS